MNHVPCSDTSSHLVSHRPSAQIDQPLSTGAMIAYAAPVSGYVFFMAPLLFILPAMYSTHFGLALTDVAFAVIMMRLFDGITDPTIGYLADRHRATGGSSKPWVVCGAIGVVISSYFLFIPPPDTTLAYYLVWSLLFFLAFTLAEIPHIAWGSRLVMDYHQRTRVYGIRFMSWQLGSLLFMALPLLPWYESSEYTPVVMIDAVNIGGLLLMVGLGWMLLAPAGKFTPFSEKDSVILVFHSMRHNKPLILYCVSIACVCLSYGMWFGLLFFYLDHYLGVKGYIALMFTTGTVMSMVSIPLWVAVVKRTTKHAMVAVGLVLQCVQLLGMLVVAPGSPWWIILGLVVIAYTSFACIGVGAPAMMGDIADYGQLKFYKDRGACYFALNSFLNKVALGVGGGLSLSIAGLWGFNPVESSHSASAIWGLKLGFILIPLLVAVIALVLILLTPLNRHRYRIIEKRLALRLQRAL